MDTTIPAGYVLRAPDRRRRGRRRRAAACARASPTWRRARGDGRRHRRRSGSSPDVDLESDAWVVEDAGGALVALRAGRPTPTCSSPSSPRRPAAASGPSCGGRPSATRARAASRGATVRAGGQHRGAHPAAGRGLVAGAPLLPHADRAQRTRRPPPKVLVRTFDERARHRAGLAPRAGRLRRPSRATCRSRSRDGARPRMDKPGWDPELWLLLHDADGHRRRRAGGARRHGPEARRPDHHARRRAPRARPGHGRTLLLLLLDAFRRKRLRCAEAAVHGRTAAAARLFESAGMTPCAPAPSAGRRCSVSELAAPRRRAPARRGGSASTRSSCPRAATGRCSASCRSASATRSSCSTRSQDELGDPAPLAAVLADPAVEVVLHAGPPGRRDPAPRVEHDLRERVRHPDRRRLRRASPRRRATRGCCTTCSRSGSRSRPRSRAGTRGRSRPSSCATRARTSSTCCRSPTSCSGG